MDKSFLDAVLRHFNPYTPRSGTESVAPLLYDLARVARHETITEFGTGFTTAFLAKAMADNHMDFLEHRKSLIERVERNKETLINILNTQAAALSGLERDPESISRIFESVGKIIHGDTPPITPVPFFYAQRYEPRLFTWEQLPEASQYVQSLRALLRELKLEDYVTLTAGAKIDGYMSAVPAIRRPVGMAWNDFGYKLEFFEEAYPNVTTQGGLLIFHSPFDFPEEIAAVKRRLADELYRGKCEFFTLQEPHKFSQNGCFFIRKCATAYKDPRLSLKESLECLLELAAP